MLACFIFLSTCMFYVCMLLFNDEEYDILIGVANVGDGSNVDVNINWTLQHLSHEGRVAAHTSILKSTFADGLEMTEI